MARRPLFFACLFFIMFICAVNLSSPDKDILPANHISRLLKENRLKTSVVGVIRSPVLKRKPYFGKIRCDYLFEVEKLGDKSARGMALISVKDEKEYRYGDRILAKGTIKKPPVYKKFDYRSFLKRKGIFALINTAGKNVEVLARDYRINKVLKGIYKIRDGIKRSVISGLPLETGTFLRAILIGDRSELSEKLKDSFKMSGTMHMIAISGLHVGLIALIVLYIAKFFMLKRELAYICTILLLIFFALMALSKPSVVRAVIMVSIFLIGRVLGRRADAYNSLGGAGLFILMLNPGELYDVGFQLSFAAVFSILYLSPRIAGYIDKEVNIRVKKYVIMPLAVSLSAWLGTFPFILHYFKTFTPVAVISNLIIIPVLFVEVVAGVLFAILGWVPYLCDILAMVNDSLIRVIFSLSGFFRDFFSISG